MDISKDQSAEQVLIALRRIMRAVDIHSRRLIRDYKLTGPQLLILRGVMREGPIPLGKLARNASLSNATITGIVDRLEKRGLIERVRGDDDRRRIFVRVTDSARIILEDAPPLLQERFVAEFRNLNDSEKDSILTSLNRIARMMNVEDLEASPFLSSQPLNLSGNGDGGAPPERQDTEEL